MASKSIRIIWQGIARRKRTPISHLKNYKRHKSLTPIQAARVSQYVLEVVFADATQPVRVSQYTLEVVFGIAAELPYDRKPRPWQLAKKKHRMVRHRQFVPVGNSYTPTWGRWVERPRPFELVKKKRPLRRRRVYAPAPSLRSAVGTISGLAVVAGVGRPLLPAEGTIHGQATVEGVGVAVKPAVGTISGLTTVHGVTATNQAVGVIAGVASVRGISGGGPEASIADIVREALIQQPGPAVAAVLARETLASITPVSEFAAITREVLERLPSVMQVSAVVREVLYTSLTTSSVGTIHGQATVEGVVGINQAVGTIQGQATVNGISITIVPPPPPVGPSTTQNIIGSYLYVQYNDDDHLQAMVAAYNAYVQAYLDWFNALNLPIYTTAPVSGPLLDWVGTNLYGYPRPALPEYGRGPIGPLNTWTNNEIPLNGWIPGIETNYRATSDDIYRRCLTWHFYKGDGKQFSIRWLKRRVERFLGGIDGVDFPIAETPDVSITLPTLGHCTITLPTSPTAQIFQAAVQGALLELPFQIAFTVDLT